ncbi:rhodanese-like domain-containing protein [Bacillus sp. DNRA2]|uniref:rhodanese-like domain-containing protein n=1 Tax=Bacillus sp. DNRA2 TaxID=2723053 RepID=UPI002006DA79|nr:rhodanese-like domain-containing protein [Bacillus sp. DNRA2]
MGKKIIAGLIVLLFIGFIGMQFMNESTSINNITTDEMAEMMDNNDGNTVFIDVREPDEFAAGHIPGITNLPLSQLSEETADFPKDAEIVMICRSGNRSMQAAEKLQGYGFTKLVNVQGGMNAWNGDIE